MSEHEAELRRRWALQHDIYETISWFLAAIDAEGYASGKPAPPDLLSDFEREFLFDNMEHYHQERIKRMPSVELASKLALCDPIPGQADVDMSETPECLAQTHL